MRDFWLKLKGQRIPLRNGETTVGRSQYCSIVLNDDLVSRQHAAFRVVNNRLEVTDLGSRNGTTVNDQTLEGTRGLLIGDKVTIGNQVLEVIGGTASQGEAFQTLDKKTTTKARRLRDT